MWSRRTRQAKSSRSYATKQRNLTKLSAIVVTLGRLGIGSMKTLLDGFGDEANGSIVFELERLANYRLVPFGRFVSVNTTVEPGALNTVDKKNTMTKLKQYLFHSIGLFI